LLEFKFGGRDLEIMMKYDNSPSHGKQSVLKFKSEGNGADKETTTMLLARYDGGKDFSLIGLRLKGALCEISLELWGGEYSRGS
jgi:hypothetical protein